MIESAFNSSPPSSGGQPQRMDVANKKSISSNNSDSRGNSHSASPASRRSLNSVDSNEAQVSDTDYTTAVVNGEFDVDDDDDIPMGDIEVLPGSPMGVAAPMLAIGCEPRPPPTPPMMVMTTVASTTATDFATRRGVVGLKNLGNTCYMNAALQCLLASRELTDRYVACEVSLTPPLSSLSSIAKAPLSDAFAQVARQALLPSNPQSVLHLADFKAVVARTYPQFVGYQQHDAQEFISVVLDALHEEWHAAVKAGGGGHGANCSPITLVDGVSLNHRSPASIASTESGDSAPKMGGAVAPAQSTNLAKDATDTTDRDSGLGNESPPSVSTLQLGNGAGGVGVDSDAAAVAAAAATAVSAAAAVIGDEKLPGKRRRMIEQQIDDVDVKSDRDSPASTSVATDADTDPWSAYLASCSHSPVVAEMHGMMRNEIKCNTCNYASVSHEPFGYLSVPVPRAQQHNVTVVVIDLRVTPASLKRHIVTLHDVPSNEHGSGGCGDASTTATLHRRLSERLAIASGEEKEAALMSLYEVTAGKVMRHFGADGASPCVLSAVRQFRNAAFDHAQTLLCCTVAPQVPRVAAETTPKRQQQQQKTCNESPDGNPYLTSTFTCMICMDDQLGAGDVRTHHSLGPCQATLCHSCLDRTVEFSTTISRGDDVCGDPSFESTVTSVGCGTSAAADRIALKCPGCRELIENVDDEFVCPVKLAEPGGAAAKVKMLTVAVLTRLRYAVVGAPPQHSSPIGLPVVVTVPNCTSSAKVARMLAPHVASLERLAAGTIDLTTGELSLVVTSANGLLCGRCCGAASILSPCRGCCAFDLRRKSTEDEEDVVRLQATDTLCIQFDVVVESEAQVAALVTRLSVDAIAIQSRDGDDQRGSKHQFDNLYNIPISDWDMVEANFATVDECIAAFASPVVIGGSGDDAGSSDAAWFCPECKCGREATKSMTIVRLPPLLIVYLKRFVYVKSVSNTSTTSSTSSSDNSKSTIASDSSASDSDDNETASKKKARAGGAMTTSSRKRTSSFSALPGRAVKVEKAVLFPVGDDQPLDLTQYVFEGEGRGGGPDATYTLYGVVNHFGSVGGGHYTAHARIDADWVYFDDERADVGRVPGSGSVDGVALQDHQAQGLSRDFASAYILFYRRSPSAATNRMSD